MHTILFFLGITKVIRAALIRSYFVLSVLVLITACKKDKSRDEIIDVELNKSSLILNPSEGKWYYNSQAFNGYAVSFHPNGTRSERIGYYNGKKQGLAQKWFNSGLIRSQVYYKANRIDGVTKTWWSNGSLCATSNYLNGVRQGFQKKWYPSGQLARQTHMNQGREEGMQQAWLENGKLYVNYEAKNGRTFGLRKAKLCYKLEDEIVQR